MKNQCHRNQNTQSPGDGQMLSLYTDLHRKPNKPKRTFEQRIRAEKSRWSNGTEVPNDHPLPFPTSFSSCLRNIFALLLTSLFLQGTSSPLPLWPFPSPDKWFPSLLSSGPIRIWWKPSGPEACLIPSDKFSLSSLVNVQGKKSHFLPAQVLRRHL